MRLQYIFGRQFASYVPITSLTERFLLVIEIYAGIRFSVVKLKQVDSACRTYYRGTFRSVQTALRVFRLFSAFPVDRSVVFPYLRMRWTDIQVRIADVI